MSRWLGVLRVLLALQVALCVVAAAEPLIRDCTACFRGSPGLALLGIAFYGALLVRAWAAGVSRDVHWGILFAAGFHAILLARMFDGGPLCGLCLAIAAVSACLVVLSVGMEHAGVGRLAALTPAVVLAIAGGRLLSGPVAPVSEAVAGLVPVRISIFTQPDCPYCDQLRESVIPEIVREFGGRVAMEYHPADELPAVRRTPTIILRSARAGTTPRVIEGLPTSARLRGVIRDLEAAP